ncbi:hypothetical protein JKP88DRAFT_332601 [Tribonema minus]|uniref:Uncharacterized protein n=1 Tax=Tribonema minus TaxID=303371 RepID=A0A836C9E4_9STRA|nr:hypothetical protein JKP88DRAFT_332601 [Tribonema minus]
MSPQNPAQLMTEMASNDSGAGLTFAWTDATAVTKADCSGVWKALNAYGTASTSGGSSGPSDPTTFITVSYTMETLRQCTHAEKNAPSSSTSSGWSDGPYSMAAEGCCADKIILSGEGELRDGELSVDGYGAHPFTGTLSLTIPLKGSTPDDANASGSAAIDVTVACGSVVASAGGSSDERCFAGACATVTGASRHNYCDSTGDGGSATEFDFSAAPAGVEVYGDLDKRETSHSTNVQ